MEKSKEKVLVFEDKWCQIWYNDEFQTVVVESTDLDSDAFSLSLSEWWTASAKILAARNNVTPFQKTEEVPAPQVPAKLSANKRTFTIVCPFCNETHTHGAGEKGDLYGHRNAHCKNDTPLAGKNPGYILVPADVENV